MILRDEIIIFKGGGVVSASSCLLILNNSTTRRSVNTPCNYKFKSVLLSDQNKDYKLKDKNQMSILLSIIAASVRA